MVITKLECLPNELFIEIFEYISSPADVHRAFIRLNQRIDAILRSAPLNIDLFWEDKEYLTLARYFGAHCNRLRIFNVCPSITLVRFRRLRSLTITEPNDAQLNSIQPSTLPKLEYLACPASMTIFNCLFDGEQQRWPYLRNCNFYFSHVPEPKPTWQPNLVLSTLVGITCSRATLSRLLVFLPRLKHLRLHMVRDDHSHWISPRAQLSIRSLRIEFPRINYDDLRMLIGPNLRRLHIEHYDEQFPINFAYLANIIMSLPQKLTQINCDYLGKNVNIAAIQCAHPLFANMHEVDIMAYDTIKLTCQIWHDPSNDVLDTRL